MVKVSRPYRANFAFGCRGRRPDTKSFLELPGADMPIVVAARLSLSYPLLFSAVPLWAIDYEPEEGERELKRCLFTDGGVSSNFPIHLFDAAMPRWPTFGMWLDRRDPKGPRATPDLKARRRPQAAAQTRCSRCRRRGGKRRAVRRRLAAGVHRGGLGRQLEPLRPLRRLRVVRSTSRRCPWACSPTSSSWLAFSMAS